MARTRPCLVGLALTAPFAASLPGPALAQCEGVKTFAPDAEAGDLLGSALAMEGNVLVVGLPGRSSDQGAVQVFEQHGLSWELSQTLTASDGGASDRFGEAIAFDGERILIGAPRWDGGAINCGAAYVFERQGGAWSETEKLVAPDPSTSANFGGAVAIDGRVAVVGAEKFVVGTAGAAYVFARTDDDWRGPVELETPGMENEDLFGRSVAIARGRIFVAAPGATGVVHVFEGAGLAWRHDARLVANSANPDGFGHSIAASRTTATIVVGAPGHPGEQQQEDAGVGYVLERDPVDGSWLEVAKLVPTPSYFFQYAGTAVAIAEPWIALGSEGSSSNRPRVWLFQRRADGQWPSHDDEAFTIPGAYDDFYASTVALAGPTLVAGAFGDDEFGYNAGAVWTYDLTDPIGSTYCSPATTNSTGKFGRVEALGSSETRADDLRLRARCLPPGNIGYFLASDGAATILPPSSAGPLCLGNGTLFRLVPPLASTDQLGGGFEPDLGTQHVPGLGAIVPGRTINFQAWYRDSAAGTSNFTDAVSIEFE